MQSPAQPVARRLYEDMVWSIFIGVTIYLFILFPPGRSDLQQADVIRGKQ